MPKKTFISLVIPVYNDADCLQACLMAVAKLERLPDEVIVVDNNSTDASRDIAEAFPFVRVIEAKKQGVVYARSCGFDAASGDIITRVDSDTILPPTWLSQVEQLFCDDSELMALSGSMIYYDFYLPLAAHWLDKTARKFMAKHMRERVFLNGSNMALRKEAWTKVKAKLCVSRGIHEDLDLAIHLQELGMKVAYFEALKANISIRRMGSGFIDLVKYCLVSPRTYARHKLFCRIYMYPVIVILWVLYPGIHLIYLSFDADKRTFSLATYLANRFSEQRVDPSTNVA